MLQINLFEKNHWPFSGVLVEIEQSINQEAVMNTSNELFQCAPESIPSVWNWCAVEGAAPWVFAEYGFGLAGVTPNIPENEARWLGVG